MKKRIKNAGQFKRFYASGIPMYRERNKPFSVAAGTMVNVIKVKTATAIVECKCSKEQKAELGLDSVVLSVPLSNFQGDKLTREKAAKVASKKSTKTPKIVAAETPVETAPVVATEPTPEVTPAEVAPETAPAVAPEAAPVVAEQPAEMAAV